MEEKQYLGPEGFWRTSPELIEMQGDLEKLWDNLENLPTLGEDQILALKRHDLVTVKRSGEPSTYKVFEVGYTPTEVEQYPKKPFLVRPEEGRDEQDAPLMVYLSKWPSGYEISASPVTKEYDNNIFVQKREDEVKRVTLDLRGEAIRQAALKMMKHQSPISEEDKRVLEIVKKATGEI